MKFLTNIPIALAITISAALLSHVLQAGPGEKDPTHIIRVMTDDDVNGGPVNLQSYKVDDTLKNAERRLSSTESEIAKLKSRVDKLEGAASQVKSSNGSTGGTSSVVHYDYNAMSVQGPSTVAYEQICETAPNGQMVCRQVPVSQYSNSRSPPAQRLFRGRFFR